jgi:hypothetical protein
MITSVRSPLLALAMLSATLPVAVADFAPAPGVSARMLYESPFDSTMLSGLSYDAGFLYTALGSRLLMVNPDDASEPLVLGDLPFNLSISLVQFTQGEVYAAWSSDSSPPFPYSFGVLELENFRTLLTADSIYDSAVNPAGDLYLVAAPGGTDTRIYRFVPATTSLVEVIHPGGDLGGIAFDASGRLYYASQTSSNILRYTPAQLAIGALDEADGEVVVPGVLASYLTVDERDRLYAATQSGNALQVFDTVSGRAYPTLAIDDTSIFGIGKLAWDGDQNRLFVNYAYFDTPAGRLYEVLRPAVAGDTDRDGASDLRVYHPAAGTWYILGSDGAVGNTVVWGGSGDLPVSGDFDGDARADIAVYNRRNGLWSILNSRDGSQVNAYWGTSEMVPTPGDYDGDGKTDIAVYERATGSWYILGSSDGQQQVINWGWNEAQPAPADYDGDGRTDLAVYHGATGDWYILFKGSGNQSTWNLGVKRGVPVPADYDGDGKDDLAVYQRNTGLWTIAPLFGTIGQVAFGGARGVAVPGDYDGDGVADLGIYDVLTGDWHTMGSRDGYRMQNWGWRAARPVRP